MSNLLLTTTPGIVFNGTTRVDAAALNLAANPMVELQPTGGLTADFLNLPDVTNALADALRGRNLLRRTAFAWEDWKQPAGLSAAAGVITENALEWWARPTGAVATVARLETAPPGTPVRSTWAASITGNTGITALDYITYVPPLVGGTLRDEQVTFSLFVRNPNGDPLTVYPVLLPFDAPTSRANPGLTNTLEGNPVTLDPGAWERVTITFDAEDYPLKNGFEIGVRTSDLSSPLLQMHVTQAQLEVATAASPWIAPLPVPDNTRNIPELTDAERAQGGSVLIVLGNGELRRMPAPGALLDPAQLGYNRAVGIPEWQDPDGLRLVMAYTGGDQIITVPAGVTAMEAHCWAAGAGIEEGRPGGVGGYTRARFPVTTGNKFVAMVGQAGGFGPFRGQGYGFGGGSDSQTCGGGGLTGLFLGESSVNVTDTARAMCIAGGGGGCSYDNNLPGSSTAAGGNGNDAASSGGMAGMAGETNVPPSGKNSGGGGWLGGICNLGAAARGGTGYRHTVSGGVSDGRPLSSAGEILGTTRTTPVNVGQQLVVPANTSPYYQNQAGSPGRPGLLVIVWNPA